MYSKVVFLALLFAGISKITDAQGLSFPAYSSTFKKDTVSAERKEGVKPLFSSVKYDYYSQLGAACKLEFKFEKATKVPLRLRLGSLQQTDYLEQKPNAVKPER